ncbi:MAG: caspase family protein [Acidobacteria bacterium]|nr:caspase family protein [Acidobacteriota bacterium]
MIRRGVWIVLAAAVCTAAAIVFVRWARPPATLTEETEGPASSNVRPELVLQSGHTQAIRALAFSPDGVLLASTAGDPTVKLWSAATGQELRALVGHRSDVLAVTFSGDGRLLASASRSGEIKVWRVSTGAQVFSVTKPDLDAVRYVKFDGTNDQLLVGGSRGVLINLETRVETDILDHATRFEAVAVSAGRKWAATVRRDRLDKSIEIWSLSTGERQFDAPTSGVGAVVFSDDGRRLAAGTAEGVVRIWNLIELREEPLLQIGGAVEALSFTHDGRTLAVATRPEVSSSRISAEVTVWNLETRRLRARRAGPEVICTALTFSPDARLIAVGLVSGAIEIRDASTDVSRGVLTHVAAPIDRIAIAPNARWLAANAVHDAHLWDLEAGRLISSIQAAPLADVAFSPGSRWLVTGDLAITLLDLTTSQSRELAGPTLGGSSRPMTFSPDERWLAAAGPDGIVRVWNLITGKLARDLPGPKRRLGEMEGVSKVRHVAFSPDCRFVAAASEDALKVWDVASGRLAAPPGLLDAHGGAAFSRDWEWFAWAHVMSPGPQGRISVKESSTGRTLEIDTPGDLPDPLTFSPDGRLLAGVLTVSGDAKLWDARSGRELASLQADQHGLRDASFSPDGSLIFSGGRDGAIRMWNPNSGQLLGSVIALERERPLPPPVATAALESVQWSSPWANIAHDWMVVTPDGLFDGSPGAWNQILWRFSGRTLDVMPVEAFFNEFFRPGLLGELMQGRHPTAPRDFRRIDRRQPDVKLRLAGASPASGQPLGTRDARIRIDVAEVPATARDARGSGIRDLRLFRNGALVRAWRGDLLQDGQGRRTLETTVSLVAGENRVTAYAFNSDNIKSPDASLIVRGADMLGRPGVMYILAIGIDKYANPHYNLRYAVADATAFAGELAGQQKVLGRFAAVRIVPLTDAAATRGNILRALARLAGQATGALAPQEPQVFADLPRAQPEDAVFIYYAGHGTAAGAHFYLIPHDLGYGGAREALDQAGLRAILERSISDLDLERAFEPIDAGELTLVIDACNSGQALEAEERRRGPMNSKGLAQLAYEKGMFVLTAAESYQAALEATELGHGYLTYALVEEGLKTAAADRSPRDGAVMIREWLDYAAERVPQMQRARLRQARLLQHDLVFVPGDEGIRDIETRSLQRPRVFYRNEPESAPLIISRPPSR